MPCPEGTIMSLTRKTALMLATLLFVMLGLNFLVLKQTIEPSFVKIEQDQALTNANRIKNAITREVDYLASISSDWAFWTDTRKFILDRNQAYVDANLMPSSLTGLKVDALLIYDLRGQLRWGMVLDEDAETQLGVSDTFGPVLAWSGDIIRKAEHGKEDISTGIIRTNKGLMMIASAPILTNESEGPAVGSLVFGRFLKGSTVTRIATQTSVPFTLVKPKEIAELNLPIPADLKTNYLAVGERTLDVYSPLIGNNGLNLALIKSQTARDITLVGAATIRKTGIALAIGALLVVALMALALRGLLINPLRRLTQSVLRVGETDDLLMDLDVTRKDEIGQLANEARNTFRQLHQAREQVRQQSYYTGVLEMSAGLMHNIRNTLNPIGIGAWRAKEIIEESRLSKLPIALAKLNDNKLDENAKAKVMTYLQGATEAVSNDHSRLYELLESVSAEVRTVSAILDAHNAVNRPELMSEKVDLRLVLEQAMKELPITDGLQLNVKIPDVLPQVEGNHLLLRQVVSNLLVNSSEAIQAAKKSSSIIEVNAVISKQGTMAITIKDDGEGFTANNRAKLFERGYSTRKTKSGGLGLHWCANTVRAMAGELKLDSPGKGQGATATVELKIASASAGRAA